MAHSLMCCTAGSRVPVDSADAPKTDRMCYNQANRMSKEDERGDISAAVTLYVDARTSKAFVLHLPINMNQRRNGGIMDGGALGD